MLFGLFLLGHGLQHVSGGSDVEDFDAVEADPPFEGGLGHVLLHLRVDRLAFGQRLVEGQLAEHGPQCGLGHLIDGQTEVVDLEQCQLHVGHLTEDRGTDLQRDIVLCDDRLLITGTGELADVHLVHAIGQWHQHMEAWLLDGPVLAEPLDHADAALLDHFEARLQEDDDEGEDEEPDHRRSDDHTC